MQQFRGDFECDEAEIDLETKEEEWFSDPTVSDFNEKVSNLEFVFVALITVIKYYLF